MKIEMDRGQPLIDAQDLGELLGLDPADVRVKMRAGKITSRFEIGEGEDAGRFRLTFFLNDKRVRMTCGMDGEVISTIRLKQGTP
ncbi:hypothetical protein HKX54_19315 [Sulfitobacter sp. M57]|uniref:DUF6522 family protein n=1 Tax=unclassified Sulfitobacter TaxID=196795 RepID=UPI0023E32DDB|nr:MULTISPECIES: DUF6522 family protein [unclassified Sulfitobacter]MDF3416629.1 hypothetical protein [Sulfitobacter sp. KE5]MDF3424109.1 hypothetical protein [Sulfitobacter sp. KE43]MDF3435174.1 hypothetical protein [Sulfitobacter sp. KE42]MDF3460822.1 hypothetical protein [Sulfitobacter sp. S74]MDF3464711.1 hypothetical protein [Sulfitobacter sp. Ks18]